MSFGSYGLTYGISTTASSKSLAVPISGNACRITNTSSSLIVYATFGVGSATAVIPTADGAGSNCVVLPPNSSVVVDVPQGANYVASIASGAGPTLVYFTPGVER